MAEVAALVRTRPLVTLSGVGGVGKTRLALAVGAELAEEFPDGVWLVELAPVGDADAVPDAIATALGITPQGGARVIDTVAEALAGRRVLIVVDNCEHVLAAAAEAIGEILARSDVPRVLATSREHLRAPGEALLTVPPLTVDGVTSDAVTLFVERARAVRPGFGIFDEQTADAVIEICATLDGLPLGIELAAARMAAMSAVEVCDRLGDRIRLLTGPELGPDRQATLRHAVAWSYDLLDDDERAILRWAVGVLRWLRPAGAVRRRRGGRRRRGAADAGLVGAQVARHRPPRLRADPVQPLRDHPGVRRRAAGGDR